MTRVAIAVALVAIYSPGAVAQDEPAAAQDPAPVAQPEPPPEEPPAAPVPPEVRAHLDRGAELFEAEGYDGALAEYQAAYQGMDGHPLRYVILFNLAQCHERLAQYDLALEHYTRYLEEGGAAAEDAGEVRARIDLLDDLLATVVIRISWPEDLPAARRVEVQVWVGSRRVGTAPGEIRMPGGNHAVQIRAAGFEAQIESITLAAGARVELSFAMRPVGARGGLPPAVFWSSTIGAGIALVGAAVLGSYALVLHGDLESRNPPAERTADELADLRDLALVTDILGGTASLFAVASVILYFATDWDDDSEEPARATARLSPALAPGMAGLVLSLEAL